MEIKKAPLDRTYYVNPRFLAGYYPGSHNIEEARHKIGALLEEGITLFIDLTEPGNLKPYEELLQAEAQKRGLQVEYRRMPIKDVSIPSTEKMRLILKTIQAELDAGGKVYLHCWGGRGRTGTVVGCYLVQQGMDGEKALQELNRLRQGVEDAAKPSPEVASQFSMVRNWKLLASQAG